MKLEYLQNDIFIIVNRRAGYDWSNSGRNIKKEITSGKGVKMDNKEDNEITFKRREDLVQFIELIKDVKDIKIILTENRLPEMKTTLNFLLKFFWILAVGVISGMATSIFAVIVKK